MVNQKTLTDRLEALKQVVAATEGGQAAEAPPGWMAKHPDTREKQLQRYEWAQTRMDQLQTENVKRKKSKRKKPEKIVISVSEPESVPGRDKLKTFRPLYNVQLMYDLDSAFITAYELFACQNDAGTIGAMLERSVELAGTKPRLVLADAAYAGGDDVALCEQAGVTLYAPWARMILVKRSGRGRRIRGFRRESSSGCRRNRPIVVPRAGSWSRCGRAAWSGPMIGRCFKLPIDAWRTTAEVVRVRRHVRHRRGRDVA